MLNQSINTHLTREEIIKSGSIYTGPELVELVYKQVAPFIDQSSVIGDFGSGYGAFIEKFKSCGKRCFGTELDDKSYDLLKKEYPNIDIYHENSLLNVSRDKYSLLKKDKLIIVGNPPYNDTTSIFKKGKKGELVCDSDIISRDFGISFLKAYNKLEPEYVCILHPLAYLIKKQNFNSLGSFKDNYRLISATIFSSKEFESIKKSNSEFPVVSALYKKDDVGMDYQFIKEFKFSIFNRESEFVLNNILTIDGLVGKYPTSHNIKSLKYMTNASEEDQQKENTSPCLQFYTLRDMNALLRNAGFVEGIIANGIDVTYENLYQYSWLFFLKYNFNPHDYKYLYGNISPLYTEKITDKTFQSEVVWYAYNNCELVRKFMFEEKIKALYGSKKNQYNALFEELNNIYNLFK